MVLRVLIFISLSVLISACGSNETVESVKETGDSEKDNYGELLFVKYCASCHGTDGKLGLSGAKDLTLSKLKDDELIDVITNGRNGMPPMKGLLGSEEDILAVSEYVKEFRK